VPAQASIANNFDSLLMSRSLALMILFFYHNFLVVYQLVSFLAPFGKLALIILERISAVNTIILN
jgi:hypothetical protein